MSGVQKPMKVMLVAGEASGDAHAADVIKSLLQHNAVYCFGIGGQKMQEAGCDLLFDDKSIAVMGVWNVIKNFGAIKRAWKIAVDALIHHKPDCLVLIDYPGFNLRLAEKAKRLGIKILYYISPQIWAWKKKRIVKIKRLVNHMAVILPFEAEIYEKAGVPVSFVGSPLLDQVKQVDRLVARTALALSHNAIIVGLLPGSRKNEIDYLLPEMIDTIEIMKQRYPHIQFVIPLASTIKEADIWPYLDDTSVPIVLIKRNSHLAMAAADVLIGSAGTATLEAAVLGIPMVVVYKMSWLGYKVVKKLVKIPFISLPNILLGKRIYPELIQNAVNSRQIAEETEKIIDNENYAAEMQQDLTKVRALLGEAGAGKKVAEIVLRLCDNMN